METMEILMALEQCQMTYNLGKYNDAVTAAMDLIQQQGERLAAYESAAFEKEGNPAADAARTYLRFWLDGNITGAKKYLEMYCEKSGTAPVFVERWMPIVAAARSIKGNEKEREFLLSWVRVSDNV